MKKILLLFSILMATATVVVAQNPYSGTVGVTFDQKPQDGQPVVLHSVISLADLDMARNSMITFTPALRSLDGTREVKFEPVTVAGSRRARAIRREHVLAGQGKDMGDYFYTHKPSQKPDDIVLEYTLPFEKWMRRSRMVIVEQTSGCCNDVMPYADGTDHKLYSGNPYVFPAPYTPSFTVSYLEPQAEAVKVISETFTAALNFEVGKTDLKRDLRDNARILADVAAIIERLRTDTLLNISRIVVAGYASPDGSEASNMKLSQARAQSFVHYLHSKYNFHQADRIITAEGKGEDWAGLRKAVESSDIQDRDRVLEIIDNTVDINRRKAAIKALSGGQTYKTLLTDYYPPLRRNEYTISYQVRGFNAEEAKTLIATRPQLLSLNEMFMVAGLYDHKTPEFKNVFDIAARQYPDSEIAQFNVGAMEIDNGSLDTAIQRLENIDTPESWNNLGVAYWKKGEYDKAFGYMNKAADAGLEAAKENLAEYGKWLDDKDE